MGVDLKISGVNYLTWSNFEDWENGTTSAPTGWALAGSGSTVARESTIIKQGNYSAKITRAGADCYLSQSIHAEKGIAYWKGRTITFGCWVYATVATRARIRMSDGSGNNYSSYHTGGSAWEFLTVTATVADTATYVTLYCYVSDGDTSVYYDGAIACEGTTTFLDISTYTESWDLSRKYRNSKFTVARRSGVLVPDVDFGEKTLSIKGKIWGTTAATCRTSWDSFLKSINSEEKNIHLFDDRYVKGYLIGESHKYIAALRVIEYSLQFIVQDPFSYYLQPLRTTSGVDVSPKSFTAVNNGNVYTDPVINFIAGSVACTALTFENTTTNEIMTFSGIIAAYKTLVIDCLNLTVSNDGVDAIANFTGDFIRLSPGDNAMKFAGTTSTIVQVDNTDRWL